MKAVKSTVIYNGIELEVYQLPNGEYHLSKTQVGGVIEKHDKSLRQFLEGTSPEALPFKDYDHRQVQVEGTQLMIHSVPLNMAAAYWTYWASKGNTTAMALVSTSVVESLTRLCDNAFGVEKSETEYAKQNIANIDTNKALFELMQMMSNLNQQMADLNESNRSLKVSETELNQIKKRGEVNKGCLSVLKYDPESNENDEDGIDPNDGIYVTCRQWLSFRRLEDTEIANTVARRAAAMMRCGKNIDVLPKRGNQVVYAPSDYCYLEEALKSVLKL